MQLARATDGLTGSEIESAFVESLFQGFDGDQERTDLTIAGVLTEFVPLSKMMAEQITELRRWTKGMAKCVFRRLSDTDSKVCRTGFRFLSDTVPIVVGQGSSRLSDSFWVALECCPPGLEGCPTAVGIRAGKEWSDAGKSVRVVARFR